MVVPQDRKQELVFGVSDSFDDETIVAREVEEGARFAWGAEFGEDILGGEGEEVVGGVEMEVVFSEFAEDPGRVILEFEVVLGGRSEFVTDTV
jgi:hypothetical protein